MKRNRLEALGNGKARSGIEQLRIGTAVIREGNGLLREGKKRNGTAMYRFDLQWNGNEKLRYGSAARGKGGAKISFDE